MAKTKEWPPNDLAEHDQGVVLDWCRRMLAIRGLLTDRENERVFRRLTKHKSSGPFRAPRRCPGCEPGCDGCELRIKKRVARKRTQRKAPYSDAPNLEGQA